MPGCSLCSNKRFVRNSHHVCVDKKTRMPRQNNNGQWILHYARCATCTIKSQPNFGLNKSGIQVKRNMLSRLQKTHLTACTLSQPWLGADRRRAQLSLGRKQFVVLHYSPIVNVGTVLCQCVASLNCTFTQTAFPPRRSCNRLRAPVAGNKRVGGTATGCHKTERSRTSVLPNNCCDISEHNAKKIKNKTTVGY